MVLVDDFEASQDRVRQVIRFQVLEGAHVLWDGTFSHNTKVIDKMVSLNSPFEAMDDRKAVHPPL